MIDKMTITNAKYVKDIKEDIIACVNCIIDGANHSVPLDLSNRHYAEIKRQVDAGELTIEDAD